MNLFLSSWHLNYVTMYFWDTMNEPANQWDYILGDSVPFIVVLKCVVDIIPNIRIWMHLAGIIPLIFEILEIRYHLVNLIINNPNRCLLLGYKILQSDPQSWLLGWFIVGLPHYWTLGQVWGISRIFCFFWNINPRSIVEYWELYQPNRMLGFDTNINIFLGVIFEYTTWYFGIFDIWRNLSIYCICEFNHLWEVIVGILTISTKCFNLPSISNILPEVI